MVYEFKFPDIGEGVTEGEIIKWLVKKGDKVKVDQKLAEIETAKAVINLPSPISGKILDIKAKAGQTIKVGQIIITFDDGKKVKTTETKSKDAGTVIGIIDNDENQSTKKIFLRKTKKQEVKKGIIKKFDLYGYLERIDIKGIRKVTAERLVEAKTKAALVTMTDDADITSLILLKNRVKEQLAKKESRKKIKTKLTLLPYIMKATIMALKKHMVFNSIVDENNNQIVIKKYFNLGFAVDTKEGLMVPVIKGIEKKSIIAIAKELMELSDKARARKIDIADLQGSSFTITNYGSIGTVYATPIPNHPNTAILGIGKYYKRLVMNKDKVEERIMLPLSLTFDHRITDGAEVARFLNDLRLYLENPRKIK